MTPLITRARQIWKPSKIPHIWSIFWKVPVTDIKRADSASPLAPNLRPVGYINCTLLDGEETYFLFIGNTFCTSATRISEVDWLLTCQIHCCSGIPTQANHGHNPAGHEPAGRKPATGGHKPARDGLKARYLTQDCLTGPLFHKISNYLQESPRLSQCWVHKTMSVCVWSCLSK